jgi:nucleotide-binding universal stress UspA family protein
MYKHLLIATDGSESSAKALAHGLALAKSLAAQVTVVTVTEPWTEGTYAALPTPSMIQLREGRCRKCGHHP